LRGCLSLGWRHIGIVLGDDLDRFRIGIRETRALPERFEFAATGAVGQVMVKFLLSRR